MSTRPPLGCSVPNMVQRYLGTEYDKVKSVADNIETVIEVADNLDHIKDVDNDLVSINTVASDIEEVVVVSSNIADVKSVVVDMNYIKTVESNLENIVTVVDNITDVSNVSTNMDYVKDVAEGIEGLPVVSYIGDEPPTQPLYGAKWYCTTDGRTYVWYEDVDSGQWVESSPQSVIEADPSTAGNIFELWKRSAAEAGLNLVTGSFEEGGVLTSSTDVLLHKESKSIYAWSGVFPNVVNAGSTPAISGGVGAGAWVDRSDVTLRDYLGGGGSLGATYSTINVDLPPFNGDLDAAIASVSGYTNFLLGQKTYYSTIFSGLNRNKKPGIKIFGSGVPVFDPVAKVLTEYTGTIIRGSLQNSAKGFEVHNLGIDLSDTVRTTYRGGVYEDALVNYNFGRDAGIKYGDLIILESEAIDGSAVTYTHCHLAEIGSGVEVTGNMEIIYGGHGYVVKCSDFNASGKTIKCYGQRLDSFIVKSDAAAKVKYARLGNVVCGKSGYTTRSGLIEAHTLNSTDAVYFDSLTGTSNEGLIQPSPGSTGYITDVHIGYLNNENSYGNYYNVIVPSRAVDWFIGKHQINNCSGGIEVQDGAAHVFISDGIVKGSTVHGYKLGGTYKHGNIKADDNAGYGVYRTSGDGLNIENISGSNNTLHIYNSIPSALESLRNSWAQHTSNNFEVNVFGRKVRVSGRLNCSAATAGSAATIITIYRPLKPRPIMAHGLASGGSVIPLWCEVTTDGRIEVDNYNRATGGFVDFFGEYDI